MISMHHGKPVMASSLGDMSLLVRQTSFSIDWGRDRFETTSSALIIFVHFMKIGLLSIGSLDD